MSVEGVVKARPLDLTALSSAFAGVHFRFSTEVQLQEAIAAFLSGSDISFEREFRLTTQSRLDFLVDGRWAIEVKLEGSAASILRQVARYAADDRIKGVLLVTTKAAHHLPSSLCGKDLMVHRLWESAF